jgi:GalNAc-alpha-(1->4)-GalNAc-alpha-(1->3)-diNAcBac-PP-undecaprenol alpha-1,4-N-acetyl-D-galactosaminyltransferase
MKTAIGLAAISLDNMAGGLERNIVYLANDLAADGNDVHILTFDTPGASAFYPIDSRVTWHRLGRSTPHQALGLLERLALIGRIRTAVRQAGLATLVCFHHGILLRFLAATFGMRLRTICSERNALSIYGHIRARKWNLNFLAMHFVDAITVQFADYVGDYPPTLRHKIHVVHNPVFPVARGDGPRTDLIVSIGRHVVQKRFDLLIRAFALVAATYPGWRLAIFGDGPLRTTHSELIDSLGLGTRIELQPATKELGTVLERARLYCQTSQWEGFPNAMAEAMAAGAIPVGLRSTSGVSSLILPEINGFLCDSAADPSELAKTLSKAMGATDDWGTMSEAARAIADTYAPSSWRAAWRRVIVGTADISSHRVRSA